MIVEQFEDLTPAARAPEVAIVGAGAVGIALAVLLARQGRQVTLIEAGPVLPPVDYRRANAASSTGLPHIGLVDGRMKALGGTTRLWGGQLMAFGGNDLAADTYPGKPGWPLAHEELMAATRRALDLLGVPAELQDSAAIHTAASGLPPELDDRLETAIPIWLPQPDFARLFAADLAALPGLTVLTDHKVSALEADGPGQFGAVVLTTADGTGHRLHPRRIVLANGTFELAGLLHRLAASPQSNIAGKAHIGRWFVDHLHVIGGTIHKIDRRRLGNLSDPVLKGGHKFTVKLRLSSHFQRERGLPNVAAMVLAPLGLRELLGDLAGLARRSQAGREGARSPGLLRTLAMLGPLTLRYLVNRRGPSLWGDFAYLGIEVEQVVCADSRIELDPADPERICLHWALDGTAEMRGIRAFCEAVRDYLARESLGELEIDPRILAEDPAFLREAHDAYHQMGGARMANGPEQGVVDPNLKVFGTENLYALGAATFPSGSFANPTLTALALAVRLADHLQGLDPA